MNNFERDTKNELVHYGVPGMKWGVHKAQKYEKKSDNYVRKMAASKTRLGLKGYGKLVDDYHTYSRLMKDASTRGEGVAREVYKLTRKHGKTTSKNVRTALKIDKKWNKLTQKVMSEHEKPTKQSIARTKARAEKLTSKMQNVQANDRANDKRFQDGMKFVSTHQKYLNMVYSAKKMGAPTSFIQVFSDDDAAATVKLI